MNPLVGSLTSGGLMLLDNKLNSPCMYKVLLKLTKILSEVNCTKNSTRHIFPIHAWCIYIIERERVKVLYIYRAGEETN